MCYSILMDSIKMAYGGHQQTPSSSSSFLSLSPSLLADNKNVTGLTTDESPTNACEHEWMGIGKSIRKRWTMCACDVLIVIRSFIVDTKIVVN